MMLMVSIGETSRVITEIKIKIVVGAKAMMKLVIEVLTTLVIDSINSNSKVQRIRAHSNSTQPKTQSGLGWKKPTQPKPNLVAGLFNL